MTISRRQLLRTAGCTLGAALAVRPAEAGALLVPQRSGALDDPLSGERLYRDVVHYAGLGGHRTGTTVDMGTSAWIRAELAAAGFDAEYMLCPPRRIFELTRCRIDIEGASYDGDPEWFPTSTGPAGVAAPLALLGDDAPLEGGAGKVCVLEDTRVDLSVHDELKKRADAAGRAGALAAVVIIHTDSGELLGRSAPGRYNDGPWCSIPLVGVAAKHKDAVVAAARRGARASVHVEGDIRDGVRPRNATGRVGSGEDLIIVTTPISALTQSGGERGPGVAIFLGLARWLGQRRPGARYFFSGNTGHETGGSGARALQDVVPGPSGVKAWLHLGATIANWHPLVRGRFLGDSAEDRREAIARGGTPELVCAPELTSLLKSAFADLPRLEPHSENALGELRTYLEEWRYRAFGFFGQNRPFHTWADTPAETGPELLEPVARACARALENIEAARFPS